MHPLITSILKEKKAVLTDGAWGTQLQLKGLKTGENPDSLCLSDPEIVESVAQSYVNAGSNVILTNTFGANRFVLSKFGLADKVKEINRAAVTISKKAAADKALVFASIGPSGQLLMNNEALKNELKKAFAEQAAAIASAKADAIIIETMSNLKEAVLAIEAAKETALPVVACMVFDAGRDKDRTIMGDTIENVVQTFTGLGVDVIGSNCGHGILGFIPICKRMRSLTGLPLWMKANAGLPVLEHGKSVYKADKADFAAAAIELIGAGANFVGGCCGTTPEFISELSARLNE